MRTPVTPKPLLPFFCLLLAFGGSSAVVQAQSGGIEPDWIQLRVPDVCSLYFPPTLEIQAKKETPDNRLFALQQEGLNSQTEIALSHYCRVIMSVEDGAGTVPGLDGPQGLTDADMEDLDDTFHSNVKADLKQTSFELIKWLGLEHSQVGNAKGLVFSYLRTSGKGPAVEVMIHKLYDQDKIYTVIFSFVTDEAELWAEDFEKVKGTFRFILD